MNNRISKIKKILKKSLILYLIGLGLYATYWLIMPKYSERRAEKNIQLNYRKHKTDFQNLISFAQNSSFQPIFDLEFHKNGEINGTVANDLKIGTESYSPVTQSEFDSFNHDIISDSAYYIGYTPAALDSLRDLVWRVECEAISIYENGDIALRYDGISYCQFEYFITAETNDGYVAYKKLDKGIFSGLKRSALFCGAYIFDK